VSKSFTRIATFGGPVIARAAIGGRLTTYVASFPTLATSFYNFHFLAIAGMILFSEAWP
jgi:hypothetical protein